MHRLVIECSFIAGALATAQYLKAHYQSKSRTLEHEKELREAGEKRMAALSELLRSLGKGLVLWTGRHQIQPYATTAETCLL